MGAMRQGRSILLSVNGHDMLVLWNDHWSRVMHLRWAIGIDIDRVQVIFLWHLLQTWTDWDLLSPDHLSLFGQRHADSLTQRRVVR